MSYYFGGKKWCLSALFSFVILLLISTVPLSNAQTCTVGDTSTGYWKLVKNRRWDFYYYNPWPEDTSCWASGPGSLINSSEISPRYEIIQGNRKTEESLTATVKYRVGGGRSYCRSDKSCCEKLQCGEILSTTTQEPGWPIWPPCATNYSFPTRKCTRNPYNYCPSYCEICNEGEVVIAWDDRCGGYGSPRCLGNSVTSRRDYQWVCHTCTDKYNALASKCGGATKIATWDNEICSGVCEGGVADDREKNEGPPCEKE